MPHRFFFGLALNSTSIPPSLHFHLALPSHNAHAGHIVAHGDKLTDAQKQHLANQIASIGIEQVQATYERAIRGESMIQQT